MSSEPCAVSMSVLMACEWVLRACYALHAAQCPDGQRLMTFDKNFAKNASKAALHGVTLLKR